MNKKRLTWLIIILLIVIIQFIPNRKPEVILSNENDLIYNNKLPESVENILRTSCYDCHSNESKYPWYSYIAPVSWLVVRDIKVGREELNFSEWESQSKMDKAKNIDKIIDEVSEGNMPMPIYTLMHSEAKLSEDARQQFADWADNYAESLFE